MNYDSVMLDLETGDTDPARGYVFQIAAVKFHSITREISPDVFDRCCLPITQPNRRWEENTRSWWGKMPTVFQGIMTRMENTSDVLKSLNVWAGSGLVMYAKPTHFDHSFLASLYRDYGMSIPFNFRTATDLNSFARGRYWPNPPPNWEKLIEFQGDQHNALDDCFHQLSVLFKLFDGERLE